MQREARGLEQLILAAVSQDFESFEAIVVRLADWTGRILGDWEMHQVELSLLQLTCNHLVRAYLIHADPPYITSVAATSETVRRHWFLITTKGMASLTGTFLD
jgi:hypothetical protein